MHGDVLSRAPALEVARPNFCKAGGGQHLGPPCNLGRRAGRSAGASWYPNTHILLQKVFFLATVLARDIFLG